MRKETSKQKAKVQGVSLSECSHLKGGRRKGEDDGMKEKEKKVSRVEARQKYIRGGRENMGSVHLPKGEDNLGREGMVKGNQREESWPPG